MRRHQSVFSSSFLHTARLIRGELGQSLSLTRLIETAKCSLRFSRIETSTAIGHV